MGKPGRPPKLDAVQVAADIAALNGNLAAVAKKHGVSRQAVLKLTQKHQSLRGVLSDAREGMLDHAESSLFRAVLSGEAWAVCFFLKTQGKARGYLERPDRDTPPPPDNAGGLSVELVTRALALLGTRPAAVGGGATPAGDAVEPEPGAAGGGVPESGG